MRLRATHFVNRAPCHTAWIGESYVAPAEKPCYLDYPVSTQYLTGQYLPAHCGWFAGPGMALASGDWFGGRAVSSAGSFAAVVAQAAVLVTKPKVREGA